MNITYNDLCALLKRDRSFRRFDHSFKISRETLEKLVALTRFCGSGRNAQPLRYRLVTEESELEAVYQHLKWAGYYTDWDGPEPNERPTAYLIQCLDTHYGNDCLCDDGLQLQAITLGAATEGLGGCIIKAFNPAGISDALNIDQRYKPRYVLALGKPSETVIIEEMSGDEDADFKYFRTPDGSHHVPKRPLSEIII